MQELHDYCHQVFYSKEILKHRVLSRIRRAHREPNSDLWDKFTAQISKQDSAVRSHYHKARLQIDGDACGRLVAELLFERSESLIDAWEQFVDQFRASIRNDTPSVMEDAEFALNEALANLIRKLPDLPDEIDDADVERVVAAFQEQSRKKNAESGDETPEAESQGPDNPSGQDKAADGLLRIMTVYTNGVSDDRILRAERVLTDPKIHKKDKLSKLDEILKLPATASAQQLADMIGCSKTLVINSPWWQANRSGLADETVHKREISHRDRAKTSEPKATDGR